MANVFVVYSTGSEDIVAVCKTKKLAMKAIKRHNEELDEVGPADDRREYKIDKYKLLKK